MANPAKYFRDEWWDMMDTYQDKDKQRQLEKDRAEVVEEMICQEYIEGKKAINQIAEDYNVHYTTVYRIAKRKNLERRREI